VALGRSNRSIAAELFVTLGTVKSHVHAIAGKLGALNRVEAVARAREAGLLD
jgi:LuxR family maltose regulon positive regulatory protein